ERLERAFELGGEGRGEEVRRIRQRLRRLFRSTDRRPPHRRDPVRGRGSDPPPLAPSERSLQVERLPWLGSVCSAPSGGGMAASRLHDRRERFESWRKLNRRDGANGRRNNATIDRAEVEKFTEAFEMGRRHVARRRRTRSDRKSV